MGNHDDNLARKGDEAGQAADAHSRALDESGAAGLPEGPAPERVRHRDAINRALLALADVVSAAAALFIGVAAIGDDVLEPATFAAAPLVAVVGKIMGLYDRDEHVLRKATLDEAPAVFRVATLFTLLFWLTDEYFVQGYVGRSQVLGIWGLLFLFMVGGRVGARRAASLVTAGERCLVLGDAENARAIAARLAESTAVDARVVARIPLEGDDRLESLDEVARLERIDRVIISPQTSGVEQMLEAIRKARLAGLKVSVLPRLFEVVGSSVEFDAIDGVTVLGVRKYGLGRSSELLKRAMDVTLAAVGLLALLPVAALAAGARLGSEHPLLTRERRLGRDGSEFDLLGFGTDDSAAGRFLREGALDRLPELVNVLRGELSLVGPRPLHPAQAERDQVSTHRHPALMPGVTGLAQVAGPAQTSPEDVVKFDYLYGANWSLWLDVRVLIRAVSSSLARRRQ